HILEACSRRRRLDSTLRATLNRLSDAGADAATVEAELAAALVPSPARSERFRLLTAEEMVVRSVPPPLVAGIVPRGALAVLTGEPGSGKTFTILDLALHIATDRSWHGHAVHAGPVVYVVAEGVGGFPMRLAAWKAHARLDTLPTTFR